MTLVAHAYPESRLWRRAWCGVDRPSSTRRYLAKGNASKLIAIPVWHVEGKKFKTCPDCRERIKAMLAFARSIL
jgi:hypothetical protein